MNRTASFFIVLSIIIHSCIFCYPEETSVDQQGETIESSSHRAHDHHEELLAGKLRYLPEFNVDQANSGKWPRYIQLVQEANRKYLAGDKNFSVNVIVAPSWANSGCATFLPLVESDLKFFIDLFGTNFITKEVVDQVVKSKRAVHYQIVNHRLFRDRACMFPSRCEGIEHFLLGLLPNLPNMDLFINVRDYPQVGKYYSREQQFPIFSFSKDTTTYADITYPAWTFWSGGPALDIYPTGIGRWDLSRESIIKKQSQLPWSKKSNVAFFRGSRTSAQRDPIVLLSRSRPDLVDAKYTKNQAWKSKEDTLGDEPANTVSFEDHCKYKYLFNAHGVAASFRLKHLFLCRSLVLNVNSDWIEFFYPPMKSWIHYVPVSKDFKDTEEILEFLSDNQPIAARIAKQGFEFIRDHLTIDSLKCYWRYLLEEYSSQLVAYRPDKADPQLVEIKSTN